MSVPFGGGGRVKGGGGAGERGVSRFTLAPGHEVLPGESKSGSVPGTSSAATLAGPAATKQPRTAPPQPSNPPNCTRHRTSCTPTRPVHLLEKRSRIGSRFRRCFDRFCRRFARPRPCRPSDSQSVSPAATSPPPSPLSHPPSPCRDVAPLDLSLRRWLGVTRSHSGSSPEWKNPGA